MSTTTAAPPRILRRSAPQDRVAALDAFRGATVAAMLLVNNPGTWSAVWWPLGHAEWHGWTPTDLIFPFFLFIVGVTTELAAKSTRGILRRGALIVLFGLLLNAFPFFWWGRTPGIDDPTLLDRVVWRFEHLRLAGVLQRIGIVYVVAALLAMRLSKRALGVVAAAILLGYWALLATGPLEPPEATVAAQVDRAVLGEKHIWSSTKRWDPEGPLSTIPAVATALLGILSAKAVRGRQVKMLTVAGGLLAIAGLAWDPLFPINKNLWTSSYVLFTGGAAMLVLAACLLVIDVLGAERWARPLVVYGLNPLVAFVGSGVMARLLSIIRIDGTSLQALSYRTLFEPYFTPHVGSFLWALCFVLFWLAILWGMARKGVVVRV